MSGYSTGRTRPFTGQEYLDSLKDGREIWIYGERVKDVTTHPAFRNTVRMIARLYDALHDPARKDVLTTPTDTGSGGYTHKFYRAPRNVGRNGWRSRRDCRVGSRLLRLDRAEPGLQGRLPRHARRQLGVLRALRGERQALVCPRAGGGVVRQSRHREPAGRSQPAARRREGRVHARRGGNRQGADRQRRESGRNHVEPHPPQLHRQQRRAADQDEAVCLRLHRPDRRPRREAVLPAVVRDDGGGDGHPVRLSALEPHGRERLDSRVRQGARAVGERVRLRRHRQGQQLLPAIGLPAALHVPGVYPTRGEDGLPGRPAAEGGGGHGREGLPRRAGAGGRGAGVAQPVLGAHRRDGADDARRGRLATCCRISITAWRIA